MLLRLRAEVRDVETTVQQTLHRDNLQAGHGCGLRVVQSNGDSLRKNHTLLGLFRGR